MSSSGGGWSEPGVVDAPRTAAPVFEEGSRYRIEGTLGRGGMGEVYLAWDAWLERHVALKCVHGRHSAPVLRERLLREARLTGRLEHPSILPVLDAGVLDDGRVFYTMRRVRGSTLAEAASGLSAGERLRHLVEVVRAIAYAHSNGVIHRDLKPSNVMIGALGETYVVDWGLARRVDAPDDAPLDLSTLSGGDLTMVGSVMGTRRYLGPDGLNGHTDTATDVYALGCCLIEVLVGEQADVPSGWHALLDRVDSPVLRAVVAKAVATDPSRRYPQASALLADLSAYVENLPVGAYDYSAMESMRRIVHTYRWPIAVGGTAVCVAALAAVIAGVQVVGERDRALRAEAEAEAARQAADAELADSLVLQSRMAAADLVFSDAELGAARALAIREDPDARGVLMATLDLQPRFVNTPPTPCEGEWVTGVTARGCVSQSQDAVHVEPLATGGHWTFLRDEAMLTQSDGRAGEPFRAFGYRYDVLGDRILRNQRHSLTLADISGQPLQLTPCEGHMIDGARLTEGGIWVVCDDDRFVFVDDAGGEHSVPVANSKRYHRGGAVVGNVFLAARDAVVDAIDLTTGMVVDTLDPGAGIVQRLDAWQGWTLVHAADKPPTLIGRSSSRPWWRTSSSWKGTRLLPDGTVVTASGPDWRLVADDGLRSATHFAEGIASATISADGRHAAVARGGGHIAVVEASTMRVEWDVTIGDLGVAKSVAFHPDGTRLIASVANMVDVVELDASTGARLGTLTQIDTGCRRFAHLDAGWWCVSTGGLALHGETRSDYVGWDIVDLVASGQSVAAVVVDDGAVYRVTDDLERVEGAEATGRIGIDGTGDVMAWEVDDGIEVRVGDGNRHLLTDVPESLLDIAVSPDGRWIAASGHDDVYVWRSGDGMLVARLPDLHEERVATVVFSDDHLFTAGWDGQLRRWSLDALEQTPTADEVRHRWRLPTTAD